MVYLLNLKDLRKNRLQPDLWSTWLKDELAYGEICLRTSLRTNWLIDKMTYRQSNLSIHIN